MRAVGELHAVRARLAVDDFECLLACMNLHAQLFDLAAQHAPAAIVDLHRHEARRKLDHVRGQPHIAQRLRTLKAEQAAAYHDASFGAHPTGLHRFQIFNGAIDEAVLTVVAFDGRHERRRTGGKNKLVVGERLTGRNTHGVRRAVDRDGLRIQLEQDVFAVEKSRLDERQIVGGFAREEFGQMDAIIGGPRLFT